MELPLTAFQAWPLGSSAQEAMHIWTYVSKSPRHSLNLYLQLKQRHILTHNAHVPYCYPAMAAQPLG